MISTHIASQIYDNFEFSPTFGQKKIVGQLSEFISGSDHGRIFILNGYAGTGKTTLIAAFVKAIKAFGIKPVLLAPTGRASKVLSQFSGERAYTIHKKIYRQRNSADPSSRFTLDQNREKDACFIVDEASMLANSHSEDNLFGSGNLLDDLVAYVRGGARCRLILVGDNAQLPPVGLDRSPALDPARMKVYGDVDYASLDEVVRQQQESGILFNATMVRCMLEAGIYETPLLRTEGYDDVRRIHGGELIDAIEECYSRYGRDETIVITRSNKRANRFNEGVRRSVMQAEGEIESGDMLMVVKNNYHYAGGEDSRMDFIANGDIARLRRLRRFEELYGFRFAEATLVFPDYNDYEIECKILLDTLASESPSLTPAQGNKLFLAVNEDYAEIKSKAKRYKEVRENDHYNALQVKFAYAVTCHKAQGGQWGAVFVDRMLFGDETMTRDMMRWLYTAMTRATDRLYFVNFDDSFFEDPQE